ncbi:MAG: hypothetical protein ACRDPR_18575, partial [Nocardioidaceae bacterium]
ASLLLRATGSTGAGVTVVAVAAAACLYIALLWKYREVLGLHAFVSLLPRRLARSGSGGAA